MKKFLMYVIVLVTMLFVGYTAYYFIRNNENIYLSLAENDRTIYMNVNESYDLPIVWEKPYSSTTVYENVTISDQDIVTFDVESRKFVAKAGGTTTVIVTPSNQNFGPFTFTISVGDGTVLNPYYIRSDLELASIGQNDGSRNWSLSDSYILTTDIDLRLYSEDGFTPIGTVATPFSGTFNGNGHTISNLTVKSGNSAGLFAALSQSAVVENLNLTAVSVEGSFDYAGSVAGYSSGTIRLINVTDFNLKNTKDNSNNGGLVGYVINNSANGTFASFGYVEMCDVEVSAQAAGNFGGISGSLIGSVIYNSKVEVLSYTELANSLTFGGLSGVVQNAANTSDYMFSVLKNSLVLVDNLTLLDSNLEKGVIYGTNLDEVQTGYSNIYKGLLYNTVNNTITQDVALNKTMNQLYAQATYTEQSWDFENVWTIVEGSSVADIRPFDEAMPQALNEYIPGDSIDNVDSFESVIEVIREYPNSGTVYEVTQSIVLDLNGATWNTIAPNPNIPMTSSILCDDNVTITIKNATISGTNGQYANSSFFGYISGVNTRIENIIFENITVNSDAETVAVVATGLLDNAVMDSVEVRNCNITTTKAARNLAVLVGTNNGTISNCKINSGVANQNTVTSPSTSLVVGGVTANNQRLVQNTTIEMYDFDITSASVSASLEFGGIAGKNGGTLTNCYNYDASLDITFNGNVYAGGAVGRLEDGLVEKCFSEALISVPYTNNNSYVGGLVGHSENAIIRQSYYANQTLQGSKVGGIVATSFASIDQCYFQGEIKAVRGAGIAVENHNSITNCYVLGTLEGMTNNSKISGICSTLPVGSSVNHCFSSATFNGLGEKHAETEAEFRVTIEKIGQIFGYYPDTGSFENSIIINYGDAYVKGTFFGLSKPGWIDCTDNQAKGLEGNYAVFKNEAGFDQDLWIFDNNQGTGAYPTLRYVVTNPNA